MANAYIGSHPSHGYTVVEKIDSNKQLAWSDSGKLFMCHQQSGSNVLVNLPKLSSEIAGWSAKFVLAAVGDEFLVASYGGTTSAAGTDAESVLFLEIGHTPTSNDSCEGATFTATATRVGSMMEIFSDGTYWYLLGTGTLAAELAVEDN